MPASAPPPQAAVVPSGAFEMPGSAPAPPPKVGGGNSAGAGGLPYPTGEGGNGHGGRVGGQGGTPYPGGGVSEMA